MSAIKIQTQRFPIKMWQLSKFHLYSSGGLTGSQNWFAQNIENFDFSHFPPAQAGIEMYTIVPGNNLVMVIRVVSFSPLLIMPVPEWMMSSLPGIRIFSTVS